MKVLEWFWKAWISRELYFTDKIPQWNHTSITNYCYNWENIFITKNKRGWEIPCGHIEKWETSIETLKRETFEEVWWKIIQYKYIWYYKVYFNWGINYSLIYMSQVDIVSQPTWEEIFDSKPVQRENILQYLGNPDLYNSLKKYNYL